MQRTVCRTKPHFLRFDRHGHLLAADMPDRVGLSESGPETAADNDRPRRTAARDDQWNGGFRMRLPLKGAAALILWRCSRWRTWLACSLSKREPPSARCSARVRVHG